jgi:hypothetical protein
MESPLAPAPKPLVLPSLLPPPQPLAQRVVVVPPHPSRPLYVPAHGRLLTEGSGSNLLVSIYEMLAFVSIQILILMPGRVWRKVLVLPVVHLL